MRPNHASIITAGFIALLSAPLSAQRGGPQSLRRIPCAAWWRGSTSRSTRPRSRASRSSATAARAPTQPRGGRLDRGAAQELRLHEHRAHQVRLRPPPPRGRPRARRGTRRPRRPARRARRRVRLRRRAAARYRGIRARTGVNNDPLQQPDAKLRALNTQPTTTGPARGGLLHQGRHDASRRDVHRRRPHGRPRLGRGRQRRRLRHGARDGAGARLQQPGRADRALDPLRALEQRGDRPRTARAPTSSSAQALQGKEDPPGRASIPEPKWLGMIQHDMMMFDHGMPRADGTMSPEQRPEADVNIEFQSTSKMRRRGAEAGVGLRRPRTRSTRPTIRPPSART